jgi:NAD(P)-dependent dehydrogenase (short-subunit alcohol dehydrogenase family)
MNADMCGQIVAIAGACGHAGAATARSLASQGAMLMLGDQNLSELHALVARIAEEGGCAQYRAADPTRPASTDMLVAHTLDAYGRIDLLLNLGAQPWKGRAERPGIGRRFAKRPAQFPTHPMHSLS